MNPSDAFDRNVSDWLHADAEHRVPEHLDAVLRRTRTERQRPAWSSLERWLPVDLSTRRSLFAGRPRCAASHAGRRRAAHRGRSSPWRRVAPAPCRRRSGSRATATIVTSRDGDIYLLDPATAQSRADRRPADGFDFAPIVLARRDASSSSSAPTGQLKAPAILIASSQMPTASAIRALTTADQGLDWFDWSPDGDSRSHTSADGERLVRSSTSSASSRIGSQSTWARRTSRSWLPPDGKEIVFRGESDSPAIFAIAPTGSGQRRQLSTTPGNDEFDYRRSRPRRTVTHITLTRWSAGRHPDDWRSATAWLPRIHVARRRDGQSRCRFDRDWRPADCGSRRLLARRRARCVLRSTRERTASSSSPRPTAGNGRVVGPGSRFADRAT